MKKIFTHLFALFLLSLVATSNVWAETITLVPSGGTFSGGNNSYCKTWTSTSEPVVTFSVAVNNMTVGAVDGGFGIASGTSESSVWNFTVNGYKIISYSFKYKLQENSTANNITITVNGNANAVTSDEKTLEVNDVNAFAASFTLSGTNETIILTDVTIEAEPLLENGAVYRFVCSGTTTVSLGASALTDVAAVSTSETEKAQQWYVTVSGSNYTFRNLANGRYLQGNNTTSDAWALTEESNNFTVTPVNGNYAIRGASHSNGYGYMHKEAGNNIVSWESGAANSQWTPIEVSYTAEELQAVWDEVEALVVPSSTVSGYQEKLDAMFTDQSCTVLNSTYAGKTLDAIKSDANYTGLPAVLRAMVEKVYNEQVGKSATAWSESTVAPADRPNGNNNDNHNLWTVENTWGHDYAKKFRVQMYEPYSVEGEITSFLRFNAHCNMDNPTGIYANAGEPIYIMVEGTIEPGAELWVAHQVGHGATNYYNNAAYTQLKEGLNVVPYFADGSQLWINYLVHTYDSETGTFPNKLSDFAPLKIHIEGGKINGFFNAMGDFRSTEVTGDANGGENLWGEVDNDADWDYYKARAALSGDFALLGHRQTLLFDFGTYNSTKGDFGVANDAGGIEYALPYHLEHIEVPDTTNCYGGSGNTFGDYSETYYPGMNLVTTEGTPNKINIMLEAWDRIMYSEHATMGLLGKSDIDKMNRLYPGWTAQNTTFDIYNYGSNDTGDTYKAFCGGRDYSDYYNHHGAAVGAPSGYMSGGWRVCNYHYNTMGSIIGKIAKEAGPTWGPAHEIGHQHQAVFNLNGQTEVTNNFFSNVAVWYMGMGTSRYNGGEGNLEHVLEAFNTDGNDLYTNNIWAITHLYYRLWLYYHLAGKNTQFWPRLFELCRQTPLVNGGQISGETSLLRFYQHACTAAGEDLTEFFRAHGYFELMTDRLVGDYSNATYNITEKQIETAITAVEANNYPKNYAILLINDGTSDTTFKHDGKTKRSLWDSNASAEYGSVTDFIEGNTSVTKVYDAVVSADGTVTMSGGEGGVGFLIFNEEGELVSFSNKASFEISDEAAYLLATGKASIVAVDAESNKTEAKVDLSAIQREMLGALIAKIEAMPIDNGSYTHVGFYTQASAGDLLAALESAKTAYESGSGYGAAYEMLYTEKEKFVNSQNLSFVPFDPSLTYVITNYEYTGHTMYLKSSDNYVYSQANIDHEAATARWQFKGTEGVYKVYNTNGTGSYLPKVAKSGHLSVVSDEASAVSYVLRESTPVGTWTIMLESPDDEYPALHENSSNKVVGWGTASNPSKWYLTAVENPNSASLVSTDELQSLIAKTEALVDVVGMAIPCALQTTDDSAPFYLYCNANVTSGGDASLPASGYNILDGNDQTFLHTVYSGNSVDGLNHYLLLDLGEGNTLSTIQFYYKTRHNGNSGSHPQVIKVEGSNDKETFVEIETISSGLPNGFSKEYTSSTLTNGNKYRYFRFMVTDTYSTATDGNGHEYFYIAEFGIPSLYTKIDAEYQAYVAETDMQTIYNAIVTAKTALESGTDLSTAKDNLQTAYDTFYALYKEPIDEKKEELKTLAGETDVVVNSVGTIETSKITQLALTTDNLYCNEVRADDCGPTADGADTSANGYVHNLTDGKITTFLHTNYSSGTAVNPPHYLRVYLGDGSTVKRFKFNYTTRDNGNNCPTTIEIEGCNEENGTYSSIKTLTTADGLPNPDQNTNAEAFESEIITMSAAYKYVRFKVTGVEGGGATFFVMSEFGFSTVEDVITIDTEYDGIVSEDLLYSTYNTSRDSHLMAAETSNPTLAQLEAQITKLTEAKRTLEAAMAQVNKDELVALVGNATTLYNKMTDGNGNMNADYATSSLTAEQLVAVKDALDAAQLVVDDAGATQLDVNNAKYALNEKYTELLTIENANVNLSGTFDKSELEALITNAAALLSTINGKTENNSDYYAAAGIAIDELQEAYDAAVDAKDRYYLTQEQYATVKEALNNSYTTINPIVAADVAGRDELKTLIANVNNLLVTIAEESAPKNVAVPLQSTTADGDFYISVASTSSGSIANLYDKNADGTAITAGDSYYGSNYGSVAAYSQYVEVDLGEGITIDKLLFDYTTRDSGHSTERPTSIKVLGSNNGTDYTEITVITEGMPVGQRAQWSLTEILELGAPYRYIRFAVDSEAHSFHMSDFNLYALIGHTRVLKEYYTTAEGLELDALCIALQSAEYAAEHYLTTDRLTEVKNMLNGYYTAANTIVQADVEAGDRTGLTGLVADTETLIEEVASVTEVVTPALSTANLYCNADNSTNGSAGDDDKLGVAALLDGDVSTHLHTTYGGKEQDDNEDHYIRVDMGENSEITAFKFSYTGRQANSNNAPTDMLVQACNTTDGEWVTLKTLTGLPTGTAPVSYESELIEMTEPYRYVRFMVTNTKNQSTTTYDGVEHKYFVMSEFGFTACPTVEVAEGFTNVTTALVRAAYNEKNSANNVATNYYMTESDYDAALAALQADYDALNLAKNLGDIPVILTTDVNNPVLYKIYINRAFNNSAVDLLAYDGESKVDVADLDFESTVQNWYFMQGTDENSYGDVLILPATAGGKALATNSFSEGTGKVSAQEPATEGYSYNWEINQIADKEWYNIKMNNGSDTYYYFSNHSGSGNKMGFYNSQTSTDGGSMFRFVLADAYSVLKDCYDPLEKEPEVYAPGYFSNAEQYNAAYDAASEYVNFANGTEEQYVAAYNELFAQKKALTTRTDSHALEDGAVYRIMNLITNTTGEKYHYIANSNAAITFPTTPAEDKSDLWVCKANEDGTYEFVSALGTATLGWDYTIIETNAGAVKENATKFVVDDDASVSGAKRIAESNNSMSLTNELWNSKGEALFNRAGNNNNAQNTNWSTDWYFQKVDNADIKFKVKITKKFSSLYLPYSVVVPDGVGAFTAVDVDGTAVELVRVADKLDSSRHGTIIPARTPVVVYIEDENVVTAEYEFEYTTEDANLPDDVQSAVDKDAIIYGKILKTPVQCEGAYRYYKLGSKSSDDVAKMYWMYKEYNASGERLYPNTDDGTHI
ncbi:MAG: discoidin domain-containing protein, partial [Bacteroidales bacterium]|nr:discoidin domain-containing protein [Bacteroidales bacterium]